MWFDTWASLARTAVAGAISYTFLILLLRISGKRTLSKMNAFDLVVTIALGSTLSSVLLDKSIALADGTLGFATLIGLQWIVAALTTRARLFRRMARSDATLLFANGSFLEGELRSQRVARDEVISAIREHGYRHLSEVGAVVLERNGRLSVLGRDPDAGVLSQVQPERSVQRLFGRNATLPPKER